MNQGRLPKVSIFYEEYLNTLIECSNRSSEHSDSYQSLAVAEQYVLYHDLVHSFGKIFTKFH